MSDFTCLLPGRTCLLPGETRPACQMKHVDCQVKTSSGMWDVFSEARKVMSGVPGVTVNTVTCKYVLPQMLCSQTPPSNVASLL